MGRPKLRKGSITVEINEGYMYRVNYRGNKVLETDILLNNKPWIADTERKLWRVLHNAAQLLNTNGHNMIVPEEPKQKNGRPPKNPK